MSVPAYVQSTSVGAVNVNNFTLSLTGVTSGNCIVILLSSTSGGGESFSVSDGVNTYTSAVGITSGTPNNQVGEIFVAKNVTGGNLTVTVNTTLTTSHFGGMVEVSGVDHTTAVQGTDSLGIQNGSSSSQNTGNVVNTSQANSYAIALTSAFGAGGAPVSQTLGGSWTQREDQLYVAGSSRASGYVGDQQIVTSGTGVQASSELSRAASWLELMVILNPVLSVTTSSISGNAGVSAATINYTGTASGSVVADGSGNFSISGLANGNYTITPSHSGGTFSPTNASETVSGSNITGVNFTFTEFAFDIQQVTIPYIPQTIFTNFTAQATALNGVSSGPANLVAILCDNTGNSNASYVQIFNQPNSLVVVGSSPADAVVYVPAGEVVTVRFWTPTAFGTQVPGVVFDTGLCIAVTTESGNAVSPTNPVTASAVYQSL